MKAVSPRSTLAMAIGLGQSGDTAAHGKLWRGEEQEDQEMLTEQPEGIAEGSEHKAPSQPHPQAGAKLNSEENAEAEEEEAERPTTRRAPKGPTQRERAEHEATHIPYRDWRRHCVRGRANNRPHRNKLVEEEDTQRRKVPRISMDYFFMSQEGGKAAEYPMLVMIDESTDNRYMRAAGRKGLGEGSSMERLIADMSEELKSWGHIGGPNEELIFKSDGEPSARAVRGALSRHH